MNKLFCVECGHKNLYEVSKPKFCAGCGAKMGIGVSSASEEAEREEANVNLRSLDVDIEVGGRTTVGDLINQSKGSQPQTMKRRSSNLPSGKDLLKQTLRDCGPSKMRDIDE